ncbi:hypothetical protein ACFJGW_04670 [Burkholderiaceae bacterium UC74_6]
MQVRNLIAAALVLTAAVAAHAAPAKPEVVQLPKVTVVGKAVRSEPQVVVLPRVVVNGYSTQTLQRQMLAANKAGTAVRVASNG